MQVEAFAPKNHIIYTAGKKKGAADPAAPS